jgi:hypothetical protein
MKLSLQQRTACDSPAPERLECYCKRDLQAFNEMRAILRHPSAKTSLSRSVTAVESVQRNMAAELMG